MHIIKFLLINYLTISIFTIFGYWEDLSRVSAECESKKIKKKKMST